MNKFRENKPTADVLMISMRAMGYSFKSAVADIIDNSISAHASDITVKFPIDPADCRPDQQTLAGAYCRRR